MFTTKLICVFVFAYAKRWFSHDTAQMLLLHQQDEKKSFREKLQAAQEICLQVQEGLDVVASLGEKVKKYVP